jgi:hypothetical protein
VVGGYAVFGVVGAGGVLNYTGVPHMGCAQAAYCFKGSRCYVVELSATILLNGSACYTFCIAVAKETRQHLVYDYF